MNWFSKILKTINNWFDNPNQTTVEIPTKMNPPKIIDKYQEPITGNKIYVNDPEDARLKIAMLAFKSEKIIISSTEWNENGGIMTIESVNELSKTKDEVRELAYYIWLENYGDSQSCWDEAEKRLGIK